MKKSIAWAVIQICASGLALILASMTPWISSAAAQTAGTGALTGTLTDASGAVVPNATVIATSVDTGQSRTVMTSSNGIYSIGLLAPGTYRVHFEGGGFKAEDVPSVVVTVTETAVLNRQLEIGSQAQQVTVQGEVETLQTSSSTLGTVVPSEAITDLPLTTRNYTNLLGLSAGANASVFNAATLGKGSTDIAVNGQSASQNNVQMDGASITNEAASGTLTENGLNPGLGLVNPDAIQEFKIQTSMFDAGYGRNPGASVNVVTKSGTNEFHGTAFEFFRNTVLNANDFFRKESLPVNGIANNSRQVLNQNQYGGVLGGPIKKDKFFFFVSYQGTWQKNGVGAQGYSTPILPALPAGDRSNVAAFTSALANLYCGQAGQAGPATIRSLTCSKPSGVGPININPVAINLLELKNPDGSYLVPGSSTGSAQSTTFSIPALFTERQIAVNGDYVINPRNTLSARYYYTHDPTQVPFECGSGGGAPGICLPDTAESIIIGNQYGVLRLTSILTNNLVNEVRVSGQRNVFLGQAENAFTDTQVGITPLVPQLNYLNFITVTGLFSIGTTANIPEPPSSYNKYITDLEGADQLSWSHGRQTIRAGFEYEYDYYNLGNLDLANGNLTFQTFPDFLLGLPGCAPGISTAACTASAGITTTGSSSSSISSTGATKVVTPPGVSHGYRQPFADAFVQDDFRFNARLTLNLGLRWEYDGLPWDKYGNASNVWPSLINTVPVPGPTAATGTLAGFVVPSNFQFAAFPAPPVGGVYQSTHKIPTQNNPAKDNFAPRLGFAWSPLANANFVVRGGYGIFYDRVGQGSYNTSFSAGEPYVVPDGLSGAANYFSTLAVPYRPATLGWTPRYVNIGATTSSNLSVLLMEQNYRTPIVQEWNLDVQYEFRPNWVLDLGYVGSVGYQLQSGSRNLNEAELASPTNPINGVTTNTTANASIRVPYLGFSPAGLSESSADGGSKFNSLQATLRKTFSHGLTMQAAYTFSRAFASVFTYNDPNVSFWGPNSLYRPQRFTVNYAWDIPAGKHEGLLDKAVSGWNVSGVTVVQDGTPLTPTNTLGGTIFGFGGASSQVSTAEYCSGMSAANVASPGSTEQRLGGLNGGQGWFNKLAFVGNTGVGSGPCTTPGAALPVIGNGTGYGNSGLGTVPGPGQFSWDVALTKTTKVGGIREDGALEFRTEFFNAFNHPQFNNPNVVDVSKATFGQITSTSVNPRLIQFALKYMF